MKIGILFGKFDPLHNGHVNLAENFRDELELDKIIIVPLYCDIQKKGYAIQPSEHRYNMCNIAFGQRDGFEVSRMEIDREPEEYDEYEAERDISDSVHKIREEYPDDELYFLLGGNGFLRFQDTCRWSKITDDAIIAVSPENWTDDSQLETTAANLRSYGAEVMIVPIDVKEISSENVRRTVRNSDDISAMVPDGVEDYIWDNYLYYGSEE